MGIWKSTAGMVEVELTSADPAGTLQEIIQHNIPVFQVRPAGDLTSVFQITRKDFSRLQALAEPRGAQVRLRRKMGLYWAFQGLLGRPILLIGILLLVYLTLVLPTRVLFVEVEGNVTVPDNQILTAAEDCGISFWADRREVRSERVKNALLSALPQLQWVGVNTKGCLAVISVEERTIENVKPEPKSFGHMVAVRDGIIESCVATKGNLLCAPGQGVKGGQILISGYTDCGLCIQATQAEGEIFAQTSRELRVLSPTQCRKTVTTTGEKRKYSLLIGKKRINLWKDSGIWDTTCGRMYEEYYITLPGGFRLPVAIAKETYLFRECITAAEAPSQDLRQFAEDYLRKQMIAGSILDAFLRWEETDAVLCLEGRFLCREMIGRIQQEKIGEYNE